MASLFGRIAGRYDTMNTLLSLNMDRRWRRQAALKTGLLPGGHALDCCCGTGPLTRELIQLTGEKGTVVGIDFCPEMLSRAKKNCPQAHFIQGNAMELPFPDNVFDASISGFALRNVADQFKAVREMARVAAPGGRVVILELNRPYIPVFKQVFNLYFNHLVPLVGSIGSGGDDAYLYLARSYSLLPSPDEIMEMLRQAGAVEVGMETMTGGVVAIFWGCLPQ